MQFYCSIKNVLISLLILLMFVFTSCKKFIEVDPPITSTNSEIVYNDEALASAVLTGIYTNTSNRSLSLGGLLIMSSVSGLSADELTLFNLSNNDLLAYY